MLHTAISHTKAGLVLISILIYSVTVLGFGCPPPGNQNKKFAHGCCVAQKAGSKCSFPGGQNKDANFACKDRIINTPLCCTFETAKSTSFKQVPNTKTCTKPSPNPVAGGNTVNRKNT